MSQYPILPAVPTLSAWQGAQRHSLADASRATPSRRARTDLDPATVVLLYVLSRTAPATFRPGQIAEYTGLSPTEVGSAVADLEEVGLVETGSAVTGRLGIVTPRTLAALGLPGYGLAHDDVRPDVRPSGFPCELSEDRLTEIFA